MSKNKIATIAKFLETAFAEEVKTVKQILKEEAPAMTGEVDWAESRWEIARRIAVGFPEAASARVERYADLQTKIGAALWQDLPPVFRFPTPEQIEVEYLDKVCTWIRNRMGLAGYAGALGDAGELWTSSLRIQNEITERLKRAGWNAVWFQHDKAVCITRNQPEPE